MQRFFVYLAQLLFLVKCSLWLLGHASLYATPLQVSVTAKSAILIDAKTGNVLFEKMADEPRYPCSVTKIATCIYALERGAHLLDTRITASAQAVGAVSATEKRQRNYEKHPSYVLESDTCHVGIKRGEEYALRDLLYALMVVSAGDAANMIAEYFGRGSILQFMAEMNTFLRSLGCKNTHFCNPSGLHHPQHLSTARDMAILSRYAMQNELFRTIVRTTHYTRPATHKQPAAVYGQSNRLLKRGAHYYPHAIGIKTGYHSNGKWNLSAAAEKDGRLLICVLLCCDDKMSRFQDAKKLFEAAFAEEKVQKSYLAQGEVPFQRQIAGSSKPLTTYIKEAVTVSYYPSSEPRYRCLLTWDKVNPPIQKGQRVGSLQILADEQQIQTVPLFAKETVVINSYRATLQKWLKSPISLVVVVGLFGLLVVWILRR